jgi:hypothetical protein
MPNKNQRQRKKARLKKVKDLVAQIKWELFEDEIKDQEKEKEEEKEEEKPAIDNGAFWARKLWWATGMCGLSVVQAYAALREHKCLDDESHISIKKEFEKLFKKAVEDILVVKE